MSIRVYDTASLLFQGGIPDTAEGLLYYEDGLYANKAAAQARFPHLFTLKRVVGFTVKGLVEDGDDFEPGNWRGNVGPWTRSAINAGFWRPVSYADISDMKASVLPELEAEFGPIPPPGPERPYRLLSAHPTGDGHICGPGTCGELPVDMDGTQNWWGSIQGGGRVDYDMSTVLDSFFPAVDPPTPPPTPEGTMAIAVAANKDGLLEVFVELDTGEVKHIKQDPAKPLQWWEDPAGKPNWLSLGTPGS